MGGAQDGLPTTTQFRPLLYVANTGARPTVLLLVEVGIPQRLDGTRVWERAVVLDERYPITDREGERLGVPLVLEGDESRVVNLAGALTLGLELLPTRRQGP